MLPGNYESGQISWRRQEFTRFLNFLVEKKTKTKTNKIKNKRVVRTIALIFFFFEKQNKCEAPGIFICVTICGKIKVTMMTRNGGAWWAAVYGVAQSLMRLSSSSSSMIIMGLPRWR